MELTEALALLGAGVLALAGLFDLWIVVDRHHEREIARLRDLLRKEAGL